MLLHCLGNGTKTLSELEEIAARQEDLAARGYADTESDFYQSTKQAIKAAKSEQEGTCN
jgi:sulfur transfer complex TusBCD TusB component (DsrH family)